MLEGVGVEVPGIERGIRQKIVIEDHHGHIESVLGGDLLDLRPHDLGVTAGNPNLDPLIGRGRCREEGNSENKG